MADRWAEIDLGAIRHNVRTILEQLPDGTRLFAVVKADGYGHGALEVSRAALEGGAWGLAVATPREAEPLQDLLQPERLLIMSGLSYEQARDAAELRCAFGVSNRETLRGLREGSPGRLPPIHLKIDTGMGRYGAAPEEASQLAREIGDLAGTWTHFASSESDEALTREQYRKFIDAAGALGVDPGLRHAANSSAALIYPEMALDAVRCGIGVYGGIPWAGLRPALAVRALLTHIKTVPTGGTVGYGATWRAPAPTPVGTVTIGYADGVMRSRSGRGGVIVRGQIAPVIGRVSMDSITIALSAVPDAEVGDVVTLIGSDGDASVTAWEVAEWSGTISYEVLTSVGPRVERRYQE